MTNSDSPLVTTFAGLPANYCFTGWNKLAIDIVSAMSSYIPGQYSVIIDSKTAPGVSDQGKLWHKRFDDGASGSPSGRIYQFYLGRWVSPHQVSPLGNNRIWFEGNLASLWAMDEGSGNDPATDVPTETTGAFWEEDVNYRHRFPLHYGTTVNPDPAYTFNVGSTGGNIEIALNANTMPPHEHYIANDDSNNTGVLSAVNFAVWAHGLASSSTDYVLYGSTTESDRGQTSTTGGDGAGATVPFNIMNPYRVGMWAKRTVRRYFVG